MNKKQFILYYIIDLIFVVLFIIGWVQCFETEDLPLIGKMLLVFSFSTLNAMIMNLVNIVYEQSKKLEEEKKNEKV